MHIKMLIQLICYLGSGAGGYILGGVARDIVTDWCKQRKRTGKSSR